MKALYYDFGGTPARIILDDHDTPETCECYNPMTAEFVERNELTLDVYDSHGSHLISKERFEALIETVRAKAGA